MAAVDMVMSSRHPWLSRNLVVVTLVSFTQDAASELLYPLLPLLLVGVLAAPPVVLGMTEGIAEATAGLTRYVAGRWSDRRGRKPFIAAGYGLAAVGKALVAVATVWPVVLAGRVVDRFGKGVRSAPRDALIASSVPASARGRAFGFHRAGDSAGAVIGPLLGLLALNMMNGDLHAALWWAVIPATLSALLVMLVHDSGPRPMADGADAVPRVHRSTAPVGTPLSSQFWLVTGVLVTIALVNFSDTLVLLRLIDIGFSTNEVVLSYVLFNIVYSATSYPAGVLTDRWPRPYVYAAGLAAFAAGYLGLGLVNGGAAAVALVALYGLFPAFTDGVGKAWISSLVEREHQGRAQGVFQGLNSGAVLVAGVWAGLAWSTGPGDGAVPLRIAGATAGVAAVAMVGFGRRLVAPQPGVQR